MNLSYIQAKPVSLPAVTELSNLYAEAYLADAYAIKLPADVIDNPEVLAHFIFSNQPSWIGRLMGIRDFIVGFWGLKTAKQLQYNPQQKQERVGIFKIYKTFAKEIILGEDDKHLDFRVSVLLDKSADDEKTLTVTTVVLCHNLLGRSYISIIKPFHQLVIKSYLRSAAKKGWPIKEPSHSY